MDDDIKPQNWNRNRSQSQEVWQVPIFVEKFVDTCKNYIIWNAIIKWAFLFSVLLTIIIKF